MFIRWVKVLEGSPLGDATRLPEEILGGLGLGRLPGPAEPGFEKASRTVTEEGRHGPAQERKG